MVNKDQYQEALDSVREFSDDASSTASRVNLGFHLATIESALLAQIESPADDKTICQTCDRNFTKITECPACTLAATEEAPAGDEVREAVKWAKALMQRTFGGDTHRHCKTLIRAATSKPCGCDVLEKGLKNLCEEVRRMGKQLNSQPLDALADAGERDLAAHRKKGE